MRLSHSQSSSVTGFPSPARLGRRPAGQLLNESRTVGSRSATLYPVAAQAEPAARGNPMSRAVYPALTLILAALAPAGAQTREEKVRADRKKVEAAGFWIYNDLPRGFDLAKKTGKPLLVVLRCIPCTECVKLDDNLVDQDRRLRPLLEKFVRVRVVSTNGLDLSLFQF